MSSEEIAVTQMFNYYNRQLGRAYLGTVSGLFQLSQGVFAVFDRALTQLNATAAAAGRPAFDYPQGQEDYARCYARLRSTHQARLSHYELITTQDKVIQVLTRNGRSLGPDSLNKEVEKWVRENYQELRALRQAGVEALAEYIHANSLTAYESFLQREHRQASRAEQGSASGCPNEIGAVIVPLMAVLERQLERCLRCCSSPMGLSTAELVEQLRGELVQLVATAAKRADTGISCWHYFPLRYSHTVRFAPTAPRMFRW